MLEVVRRKSRQFSEGWTSIVSPKNVLLIKPPVRGKDDEAPIKMRLGDVELSYKDLKWEAEGGATTTVQVKELKERNRLLEAENELLKFKLNYLLDLLTVTKLDALQLEGEVRMQRD